MARPTRFIRMKQGVNLASRPARRAMSLAGWTSVVVVLLGTLFHIVQSVQAHRLNERLRVEVRETDERLRWLKERSDDARANLSSPQRSRLLAQLSVLERSGVTGVPSPAEVFAAVAEALPSEARVVSMVFEASPPDANLHLEVTASRAENASDIVARLSSSPLVRRAEILEEKHGPDGDVMVRIGVGLGPQKAER